MYSTAHNERKMRQRCRPPTCRPRESPKLRWQFSEGTARAMRRSSQEREQRLVPAVRMAHEPGVAQSLHLPRSRLRQRIAKTACARKGGSLRRSARRQWLQKKTLLQSFFLHPVDRKSTRLNSSHSQISYAVFCLK